MMKVSVGIVAYNEEKNLDNLLKILNNQITKKIELAELVLISDGSSDKTNKIIKNFKSDNFKIKKFIYKKRQGKYKRINKFIEEATNEILVLCSGDILIKNNCIEKIGNAFNKNIDLVTTKAVPRNISASLMNRIVDIYWALHDDISKIQPKGSSLMAFRKKNIKLIKTSVDEVYIISLFAPRRTIYLDNIIYYNKGPSSLLEFISQIRRYHNGHKILFAKKNYRDIALNYSKCFNVLIKYSIKNLNKLPHILIFLVVLLIGRALANIDYVRNIESITWDIAKTTKDLTPF